MSGAAVTLPLAKRRRRAHRRGSVASARRWPWAARPWSLPLCWLLRRVLGLDDAELAMGFLTFHAATVLNDPHFAVTYLLFYKDARARALGEAFAPRQRARWWVAGVLVPIALAAWAAVALATRSAPLLGWMVQLMFFLVGWHYVKQGFGVLTVLSARRGVRWSDRERRVVLAHCFAGWAYAWASPADAGRLVEEKGVVYRSLAHPLGVESVTFALFLASAAALGATLVRKWHRERRPPPLAPLCGLLVTVWLWTVYSAADPLMRYLVPALHSVQYLYFVWLLRRNEARASEGPPLFGRPAAVQVGFLAASAVLLGWVVFRGGPSFLDDVLAVSSQRRLATMDDLGPTPYFAAVFVFVNIHHYFMDTVIWRRDNPQTRHLLGGGPAPESRDPS
ncbi:MAG: hypothetical protein WKG00_25105 [Polyangiaceae bacterium]